MTDENYDLADWKPWGDYPESGEEGGTDTGSNTGTGTGSGTGSNTETQKPGPGSAITWRTLNIFSCFRWYNGR